MNFPRDLELRIIKNFDIDTRLKMGVPPCRLKVPERVTDLLKSLPRPFGSGYVVLGDDAEYILTYRREIITKTFSYYSDDFVIFKLIGY